MQETFTHGRSSVTLVPTGGRWSGHCYVVRDDASGEQVVVDPGGRAETIRSVAEEGNARVTAVVLTHAHHDHVAAASDVAEHFGVRCHIHSADLPLLRKAPAYAVAFGGRPFPPVRDAIALEGPAPGFLPRDMRVLHTPGHTPGSCCLLFPGFALTGDTLLQRMTGRTDLPGCDRDALIDSVDSLLARTSDDDVLYGGHLEPWRAGDARRWWAETGRNGTSRPRPREHLSRR